MNYISGTKGNFLLVNEKKTPKIYVASEDAGVIRAAEDLCKDVKSVTGLKPSFTDSYTNADVIIKTAEEASEVYGKWECYKIGIEDNKLVISGSDKRGTIYGIYDLIQKIGVSPCYWWADVVPKHRNELYINLHKVYVSDEPSVKYRGIFINGEENFASWALNKGNFDFVETYKRVYELLLRLKANIMWPAMHGCSPYFRKNPDNAKNADLYGIMIGTSHCEQMMRNNICEYFLFQKKWISENPERPFYMTILGDSPNPCAYVYTDVNPDTSEKVYNKELIHAYWMERLQLFGQYDNMYTMGMRGLHDSTWQPSGAAKPGDKARLIEEIIAAQRGIMADYIKEKTQKDVSKVPQLFIPYKEVLEIYNSGMKVPDYITLMWTDDNYGYIRQIPTMEERKRSGGAGMYHHLSYCGNPISYL